jgi:hypothetical protein
MKSMTKENNKINGIFYPIKRDEGIKQILL